MNKKYIVSLGLAAAILAGGGSFVLAEQLQSPAVAIMPPKSVGPAEMVLQVGPNGKVLLRGTVEAVGGSSLTVKSWGGSWVINTSSSTQLMPGSMMSQFAVGDFVGVQGVVTPGAIWTIDAGLVRNWTARKEATDERKAAMPKNWQGIASNINVPNNSFTLTINGVAHVVNVAGGAKVVNQQYAAISLADIKDGDTVRIYATLEGTTATALVVRDISVGAKPMVGNVVLP